LECLTEKCNRYRYIVYDVLGMLGVKTTERRIAEGMVVLEKGLKIYSIEDTVLIDQLYRYMIRSLRDLIIKIEIIEQPGIYFPGKDHSYLYELY